VATGVSAAIILDPGDILSNLILNFLLMNTVFKKLNFKGQSPVFILNAPDSFVKEIDEIRTDTEIRTSMSKAKDVSFFLAFVTKQKEVDDLAHSLGSVAAADAVVWFAYPKGTSKKYKCEFNRDNGWNELGKKGFEGVRMIAIDDDWSALRFRKAEHIKTMTRSFAMSDAGKRKVEVSRKAKNK
jgi:hypothetical protein